ncbi:type III PLP-dependent enzyme [Roseovarius rhodophyticola]|uniref:ornithine decarboxylase n=1 Tax=Roseovarius rhodophyticola TaxID=3080827 RepID=A0ABZ2TH78_9RHOB|nr:type III PLP-dependent enzyme [Roseovarius sp. W115]MDV2930832.1 type III PLP-dependent enzyme [Roseovarius sp. W115]
MYTRFQWPSPIDHLRRKTPDTAILYFCPAVLQATAQSFQVGFPGLVTYAVKANPNKGVLENLSAAGLTAFDVASPAEMAAVRAVAPDALLHYNNPVRSPEEVRCAIQHGVVSYSVDELSELDKLNNVPQGTEIAVRLALPVKGAAYDFGAKFGAEPEEAAMLLRLVAERGHAPAICFHPGTQCADPEPWGTYIRAVADMAKAAEVKLARINVGGGFASNRDGAAPDLTAIFEHIGAVTREVFGAVAPQLLCEPGRAMVADAFCLATRVKATRDSGAVFLNDGLYGALAEARDMGAVARVRVVSEEGTLREGAKSPRIVFGPTCDSLDRLPERLPLPSDIAEGDYVIFDGMGAYGECLATAFNGYGPSAPVLVSQFE